MVEMLDSTYESIYLNGPTAIVIIDEIKQT